jgi:hypothetical protein
MSVAEIKKTVAHKIKTIFVVYQMYIFTFTSSSVMYKELTSPATHSHSASCEMELLFMTSPIYYAGKSKFQGKVISYGIRTAQLSLYISSYF